MPDRVNSWVAWFRKDWLTITCGALLIPGFLIAEYAETILRGLTSTPERICDSLLAETTMQDGTILSVHAFRRVHGAPHLNFYRDAPDSDSKTRDAGLRTLFAKSPGEVVLWLTRRDPESHRSLDFAWWKRTTLIDQSGHEIEEEHSTLHVVTPSGTSSHTTRPFPGSSSLNDGASCLFVVSSGFRLFRAGPTVRLRFHNLRDEIVAEITLPNPCPASAPPGTVETLPASQLAGDIKVTLKEWRTRPVPVDSRGSAGVRRMVEPVFEFQRGDRLTEDWFLQFIEMRDSLGNRINKDDVFPSAFSEPAWIITGELLRHSSASFAPDEFLETDWLPIPAANQSSVIHEVRSHGSNLMRVDRILGPGRQTYEVTQPGYPGGKNQTQGRFGQGREFQIEVQGTPGGSGYTVTSQSSCPGVVISEPSPLEPGRSLFVTFAAVDDQHRPVELSQTRTASGWLVFLAVRDDATRVRLRRLQQIPQRVEFTVPPPE